MKTVHFVALTEQQYDKVRASRVWADYPHYYHKWLDDRVWTEVADDDIVVMAQHAKYNTYVWDASAVPSEYTD